MGDGDGDGGWDCGSSNQNTAQVHNSLIQAVGKLFRITARRPRCPRACYTTTVPIANYYLPTVAIVSSPMAVEGKRAYEYANIMTQNWTQGGALEFMCQSKAELSSGPTTGFRSSSRPRALQ